MPHCPPDQLALAALGEPLPDDDAAHLADCARCSAEVASLRRPVDLSRRRLLTGGRPSRRWLAVAAALLFGAGMGGGAVALTRPQDAGGTVVAQTALDPLLGNRASGSATVRENRGGRVLQVDLTAPRLEDGYYEVWLMETGAQLTVPVGVLHTGDTELPLPDGLDLAAYPLVDVSVEPLDGQPTHSGISVVRGRLSG